MKKLVQLKNKENENLDPINLNYEKRIKNLEGTILFSGASNENIILNDSALNYKYIKIFYNANDYYNSVEVYQANNKQIYLGVNVVNSDASYFQNKIIKIVEDKVINIVYNQNTVGSAAITTNDNNIYINRIIGYK